MLAKYVRYAIFLGSAIFLLSNRDLRNLVHNCIELRKLHAQETALDADDKKMLSQKSRLLNPKDDYVERLARKELNLVRKGEVEFRFTPPARTEGTK
jgi:cell division protein FtsB